MNNNRAFVLPSLLLVTIVLLTLAVALLASGTSGLRMATHDQQTDQALYAAEAGLARVAAKLAAGSTDEYFTEDLESSESRYEVRVFSNETSSERRAFPGGPLIPPQTAYVLSEGFSRNATQRKSGALFRIGLQAFKVGALGKNMVSVENSLFDAFNGADSGYDPSRLETGFPLLASNQSSGPTMRFNNSQVSGDVFLGPGGDADSQVENTGSTLGSIKPMASTIDLEEIVVPDRPDGNDDPIYIPPSGNLAVTTVDVNGTYHFSDGNGLNFSVRPADFQRSDPTAHIDAPGLRLRFDNDPLWVLIQDPSRPGHDVTFYFDGRSNVHRDNGTAGYDGGNSLENIPMHSVLFGDLAALGSPPAEENLVNATTINPGHYDSIIVEDGFTSTLSENDGVYVIDNLIVRGDSTLKLPASAHGATIYVKNTIIVEGEDALVNETLRAPKLKVMYTGTQPVNLAGGSRSFFTLLAPDAEVSLDAEASGSRTQFFGALVGLDVTVKNADFHFDTSTSGIGTGTVGTAMTLLHHHRL